jgi:flagellar biosynthesis protein FlhB
MREGNPPRQQQQRILKRAKTMRLSQNGAMNITKNLGMLLLAIYLILVGIMALVHFAIPVILTGILALAAGILILIGK